MRDKKAYYIVIAGHLGDNPAVVSAKDLVS